MWSCRQDLVFVKELWFDVVLEYGDRVKMRIDNPHQGDTGCQILVDLLVDIFQLGVC
jgi:hypothetical protein